MDAIRFEKYFLDIYVEYRVIKPPCIKLLSNCFRNQFYFLNP